MSPDSEAGSERDQFHPNMIHLLRKEEHGKNRIPSKEPIPNIQHWQLELMLKIEGNVLNLYVINKTSERDEERMIEQTDLLFPVIPGKDKVIKLGKDKGNLHLTILHPKTEKRAKGDEISLDKIVKERIQNAQERAEVQKRYQGKNSKNLKKVQLKCEVFDLNTDNLIDSAISEVIRDKQSKDYGSLELKYVRPLVSCCEGGRDVLVVTEHPMKKGTVVPVFQLFDDRGDRSEAEEQWLKQPQVSEEDDRTIKFFSPKQENYEKWSHLSLKLKLRRSDVGDDSESISSCSFEYRQHDSFQFPVISDLQSGKTSLVCLYCNSGILDGDQTGLSGAKIPQHSGPGLKRRRMSSTTNRNQVVVNHSSVIHSVLVSPPPVSVVMEEPDMLQTYVGATTCSSLKNQQMDGEIPSVNLSQAQPCGENWEAEFPTALSAPAKPQTIDIWQKLDEDEKSSSSLNTPEMEDEPFTFHTVNPRDVQPPRHVVPDGFNPRQKIVDPEQQEQRSVRRRPPPPPPQSELPSRGLRWWTVQSLCGDDQEAQDVFRWGGGAGLRRKIQVVLRHHQIPVILLLAFLLSFIFPLSPENMIAVLAASVLAVGSIIYQNLSKVNGE